MAWWVLVLGIIAVVVLFRWVFPFVRDRARYIKPRVRKPFLEDPGCMIIAHQGASAYAPANSLEAFRIAMEQGAEALETDVQMTKDGILVLCHDWTINRCSNGQGAIEDQTLAELRELDFGYYFTTDDGETYPYRGKGIKIATLEELFQAFPGVRVNIEIKQVFPALEAPLWELVQKYNMEDHVIINFFSNISKRRWLRLAGDRVAVGLTITEAIIFFLAWIVRLEWLCRPNACTFQIPVVMPMGFFRLNLADKHLIRWLHRLGIEVVYWDLMPFACGINDPTVMRRLVNIGADGILTDAPDLLVRVIEETGQRSRKAQVV